MVLKSIFQPFYPYILTYLCSRRLAHFRWTNSIIIRCWGLARSLNIHPCNIILYRLAIINLPAHFHHILLICTVPVILFRLFQSINLILHLSRLRFANKLHKMFEDIIMSINTILHLNVVNPKKGQGYTLLLLTWDVDANFLEG